MKKTLVVNIEDLNPYIRNAGYQGNDCWPTKDRKIYDHELFYCIKGRGHITIKGIRYTIKKGSVILVEPNIATRLKFDKTNPAELYWIHFDFTFLDDKPYIVDCLTKRSETFYLRSLPNKEIIRPHIVFSNGYQFPACLIVNDKERVKNIFENIIKAYQEQDIYWQLDCKVNLLQLLKIILKQTYDRITNNDNNRLDASYVTYKVMNYISNHYSSNLKLKEIADYVGYSSDYISKIFKRDTGKTIIKYLNEYRIDKAKILLKNSDFSMSQIADMVGLIDQFYFSKRMKAITGLSPSQWKKNN